MKTSLVIALLLSGCVSARYCQRTIYDVKKEEREKAVALAEAVRDKEINIYQMLRELMLRELKGAQ